MELCTLHPIDESLAAEVVAALRTNALPPWLDEGRVAARPRGGSPDVSAPAWTEREANWLTHAFARLAATRQPSFFCDGMSLTAWEARIDRGIGMLMRPPARLFIDAGLEPAIARAMPIRLDLHQGLMGGAYIPARLVGDLERLLDERLVRHVRRLLEAERDGVTVMAGMMAAAAHARANGLALFEAMDVVTPDGEALAPGGRVIVAERNRLDKALRRRLEEAARPPKQPGLLARLTRRPGPAASNGHAGRPEERR